MFDCRVFTQWDLSLSHIVHHNHGTVFVTWRRWRIPWKPRHGSYSDHQLTIFFNFLKSFSWTDLLGTELSKVRHIIWEGCFPAFCWADFKSGNEWAYRQSDLLLTFENSTFPHRLQRFTLVDVNYNDIEHLFASPSYRPTDEDNIAVDDGPK